MMRAWHFVGDRLRNGYLVPPDGERLIWYGELAMCKSGLHASVQPFDALNYAPGPILCMVECNGGIIHDTDKLVCSQRTIITRMDATELLLYFARMQAVSVVHLWNAPDFVLDYLMTGDELLVDATWDAALDAARDAAGAAAWDAAWDAARDAAWAAARAAAGDAAWDGAWVAAWAAARAAAWAAAGDTVWAAAGDATWDAARDAARDEFNDLVYECFGVNP
jgi:hypothetical protein